MKWKGVSVGLLLEAARGAPRAVRTGLDVGLDLHLLDSFPSESGEPLKVVKGLGGRLGLRKRGVILRFDGSNTATRCLRPEHKNSVRNLVQHSTRWI